MGHSLSGMIKALEALLKDVHKKDGGKAFVSLNDGARVRQAGRYWLYRFLVTQGTIPSNDTPVKVLVGDLQVILDTLEFNLPFAENKRNAQAVPNPAERERFCEVLREELRPWCDRFRSRLAVRQSPPLASSPWQTIAVRTARHEAVETVPAGDWLGVLRAADEAAASEILVDDGSDGLLIARLAQRRYWSETQARLLAQRIGWSHLELLKGHATA